MENNFGGGFNRIPNPNSFQRRNDYSSVNNSINFNKMDLEINIVLMEHQFNH